MNLGKFDNSGRPPKCAENPIRQVSVTKWKEPVTRLR